MNKIILFVMMLIGSMLLLAPTTNADAILCPIGEEHLCENATPVITISKYYPLMIDRSQIETHDWLQHATAHDAEDGDLTHLLTYSYYESAGDLYVTYRVTDSYGNTTRVTRKTIIS